MTTSPNTATDRLRRALSGADVPLVLLGNFEVEQYWAVGERGLPRMSSTASTVIVNRMDEFTLLLGGPRDHVVVKAAPDPDYVSYLTDLGFQLPQILSPARQDPRRPVTADVMADTALLARLAELGDAGAWLWPHGVSAAEEELASVTGLPFAGAGAAVCKKVNSKIYSRLLADRVGLRQPDGRVCRDVTELTEACAWARGRLLGGIPVVAKDAFGVSGKGLLVIREEAALQRLQRMVGRHAEGGLSLLFEEWVDKHMDLNYQMTVDRAGTVRFDFVKEALTEAGAHRGHRIPARLTDAQLAELRAAALAIGKLLAADGYVGVVGVDAMVDPDGGVYPVTEINARNNMSTYQERIREMFVGERRCALATHYPLQLDRSLPFDELDGGLGGLLLRPGDSTGLLVNNFATVNAAAATSGGFEGRLYAVVVADDEQDLESIDQAVRTRLHDLTKGRR
ncbi:ATP-grasp domain-containing protein [Streptomyces sp. NPDC020731]|uniref:preATP grasp domain-containing protein n=1 Tax=Streptomyces sp. NPDC020731 TaxID=3365085 RepID=UPI003789DCED